MRDPNRWQPLALEEQIAQNGLPIPGSVQNIIGPHWGHVTSFAMPPSEDGIPIDPGPPPLLGDPATDEAFKQAAVNVLRLQQRARSVRRRRDRHQPWRPRQQHVGKQRRSRARRQPGDRRAVRAERGAARQLRPDARRVLGRRAALGDPARPLERDRQRRHRLARLRAPHRRGRRGRRPARVGRQAVLRAQRRRARRGGRGVGPEGLLRLGAADLDGSLHGRHGPVERSRRPVVRPRGPAAGRRPRSRSITAESSAPGERHEELADHVGEIAVRAWRGFPADPETETSGVGWILAVDWVPVPAVDVRDAGVPRLRLRAQHVQPGRGRGDDGVHRRPLLPGRARASTRCRGASCSTRRARPRTPRCSGRPTSTPPTRPACRGIYMGIHITEDDFNGRQIGSACGQRGVGARPALLRRHGALNDFPGFVVVVYDLRVARIHGGSRQEMGEETRMHIRRSTALTVSAASVLAVGAFGPIASATTVPPGTDAGGEGGGDCVVGVSWNNFQEPRWAMWDEPALQGAIEAGGGSYISTDAQSSAETQASDVENLIAQGANVLVILAQDGTAILPSVASAVANGIPVIAYDRLIEDPGVLYMTFDNVEVGRIHGQHDLRDRPDRQLRDHQGQLRRRQRRLPARRVSRRSSATPSKPATSRSSARPTPTTGTRRSPRPRWSSSSRRTTTTSRQCCRRTTAWPVASSPPSRPRASPARCPWGARTATCPPSTGSLSAHKR